MLFEETVFRVCEWIGRKCKTKKEPIGSSRNHLFSSDYLLVSFPRKWTGLYLRHVFFSDLPKVSKATLPKDAVFHNHSWETEISIVLAGTVVEEYIERTKGPTVHTAVRGPLSVRVMKWDQYHRLDLQEEGRGAWLLTLTGPRTRDWNWCNRLAEQAGSPGAFRVLDWRDALVAQAAVAGFAFAFLFRGLVGKPEGL